MNEIERRIWRRLFFIAAALLLGGHLTCGPLVYYSPTITATVIDEETTKPIAGAVVLASWRLYQFDGATNSYLYAGEAITGQDGKFVIPSWGPRLRPPIMWLHYDWEPELTIYCPGYAAPNFRNADVEPRAFDAGITTTIKRRMNAGSLWNGRSMPVEPASTIQQQVAAYDYFLDRIVWTSNRDDAPLQFGHSVRILREAYAMLPKDLKTRDRFRPSPPP